MSTSYLTASFLRHRSHAKIPFFSSSSKLDLSIFSGDSRSILRFLHHLCRFSVKFFLYNSFCSFDSRVFDLFVWFVSFLCRGSWTFVWFNHNSSPLSLPWWVTSKRESFYVYLIWVTSIYHPLQVNSILSEVSLEGFWFWGESLKLYWNLWVGGGSCWTHHKDRLSCICFALLVQCFVVVAVEEVNLLSSRRVRMGCFIALCVKLRCGKHLNSQTCWLPSLLIGMD